MQELLCRCGYGILLLSKDERLAFSIVNIMDLSSITDDVDYNKNYKCKHQLVTDGVFLECFIDLKKLKGDQSADEDSEVRCYNDDLDE